MYGGGNAGGSHVIPKELKTHNQLRSQCLKSSLRGHWDDLSSMSRAYGKMKGKNHTIQLYSAVHTQRHIDYGMPGYTYTQ